MVLVVRHTRLTQKAQDNKDKNNLSETQIGMDDRATESTGRKETVGCNLFNTKNFYKFGTKNNIETYDKGQY